MEGNIPGFVHSAEPLPSLGLMHFLSAFQAPYPKSLSPIATLSSVQPEGKQPPLTLYSHLKSEQSLVYIIKVDVFTRL